jgi:hypothetical protein
MMYYNLSLETYASADEAFTSIPENTTTLSLSGNNLHAKTSAELYAVLARTPAHVTQLRLGDNSLWRKTGANLAQAFSGIPANVTSLDLSENTLSKLTGEGLRQAFSGIPTNVTSLDLSDNQLRFKTNEQLVDAFSGIPLSVQVLDLSGNRLCEQEFPIFAIPFDIEGDAFVNVDFEDVIPEVPVFSGIPGSVTTLILRDKGLYEITAEQIAWALSSIPLTINVLDLSSCGLWQYSGSQFMHPLVLPETEERYFHELAQAFADIPAGVTSLLLQDNELCRIPADDLIAAFVGIPETVTLIDLKYNRLFYNKSPDYIDNFLVELGDVDARLRYDLRNNHAPACARTFAQAVVPLIQMETSGVNKGQRSIPLDVITNIASCISGLSELNMFQKMAPHTVAVSARKDREWHDNNQP